MPAISPIKKILCYQHFLNCKSVIHRYNAIYPCFHASYEIDHLCRYLSSCSVSFGISTEESHMLCVDITTVYLFFYMRRKPIYFFLKKQQIIIKKIKTKITWPILMTQNKGLPVSLSSSFVKIVYELLSSSAVEIAINAVLPK